MSPHSVTVMVPSRFPLTLPKMARRMAWRIGMAIVVSLRSGARRHCPERAAGGMELGALTAGVSRDKLNLLVITLETTRADRLGAYGAEQIRTPGFDRLARRSTPPKCALSAARRSSSQRGRRARAAVARAAQGPALLRVAAFLRRAHALRSAGAVQERVRRLALQRRDRVRRLALSRISAIDDHAGGDDTRAGSTPH